MICISNFDTTNMDVCFFPYYVCHLSLMCLSSFSVYLLSLRNHYLREFSRLEFPLSITSPLLSALQLDDLNPLACISSLQWHLPLMCLCTSTTTLPSNILNFCPTTSRLEYPSLITPPPLLSGLQPGVADTLLNRLYLEAGATPPTIDATEALLTAAGFPPGTRAALDARMDWVIREYGGGRVAWAGVRHSIKPSQCADISYERCRRSRRHSATQMEWLSFRYQMAH